MAVEQSVTMAYLPDHLIWLNDDFAVIVGAFADPDTGEGTHSRFRRIGRSPLHVELLEPSGADQCVDTIAGNLFVLPSAAYQVVGNVDTRFVHLGGDIDYGHRAVTAGLPLYLAPSDVGACRRNFAAVTYVDPGESMLSGCEWSSAQNRSHCPGALR